MKHVVALSGGKDSTAMALRLAEVEPDIERVYVCTPTGNELPEMFEHWLRLGELLGSRILPVVADSLEALIERQGALPNWRQRWCTRMLKITPFLAFLEANAPAVAYVGLRADEPLRMGVDYSSVPGCVVRYPLREWSWNLEDVENYLIKRRVDIPKRTDCGVCFFQRIGQWFDLYKEHPDAYAEGERWEELTGHTFRSPGRDTWPAALSELRDEFDRGRIPKDRKQPELFGSNPNQCRTCTL